MIDQVHRCDEAENCFETGLLSELEYEIYLNLFNLLVNKKCKTPSGFIYLKVSPEIAKRALIPLKKMLEY